MKYKVTFTVEADSKEQAARIIGGLQKAMTKVTPAEMEKMIKLLGQNPAWIDMAKKFV